MRALLPLLLLFTGLVFADFQPYNTYRGKTGSFTEGGIDNEYIRRIISAYRGVREIPGGNYSQNAHAVDNTMALLGMLLWGNPDQHNEIRQSARQSAARGGNLTEDDAQLSAPLAVAMAAATTYGNIVGPDKKQAAQYEATRMPMFYFRVGQQAVRSGLLQGYADRIVTLKKQIVFLENDIANHCRSIDYNTVELGGVRRFPSQPFLTSPTCNCTAELRSIYALLGDIQAQLADIGDILCMQYLLELHNLKIQALKAELEFAHLAATYGILNNQEKNVR